MTYPQWSRPSPSGALPLDAPCPTSTPVFTTGSGRRSQILQWAARCLAGTFVVVAAAIGFTLVTHVPLPGLDTIITPPSAEGGDGAGEGGTAGEDVQELNREPGPATTQPDGTPASVRGTASDPVAPPSPRGTTSAGAVSTGERSRPPVDPADAPAGSPPQAVAQPQPAAPNPPSATKPETPPGSAKASENASPRSAEARTKARPSDSRGSASPAPTG